MKKRSGSYPRVRVQGDGRAVVSQAGAMLLVETVRKSGLDTALSAALAPWRKTRTVHDPGKVLLDVALAVALGGDCLADVGVLRAEPAVFGPVASDPTVSRLVDTLAAAGPKALAAIRSARAQVRARVWELAGSSGPAADGQVAVDIDGVLVLAHSEKQDAAATWKKTYGHHPLVAFVDHGPAGSGEPVAALLRPGNAGSNTAADHITATRLALAQLPARFRRGRRTLIRTDSAGGTHAFVAWLAARGRWLSYSVGMTVTDKIHQAVLKVPASAWTPAVERDGAVRDGAVRDGAWVAELAGDVLDGWPHGMRLIVRKERPHPGAQLRFTDVDGNRITLFATNTEGPIAALELRHRLRARAEDRVRNARDTGLRNLPLHEAAQNQVWLEIVSLALDLLAWMPMLALTGDVRRWEPKKLCGCSPPPHSSSPPAAERSCGSPATGPGPTSSPTPPTAWAHFRTPADQRTSTTPPTATLRPERGTRRPPDATAGPPARPRTEIHTPQRHRRPASKLTDRHETSRLGPCEWAVINMELA